MAMNDCLQVVDLRVESLVTPMGVTATQPRLSWRSESSRRGMRQAAYRVSVASSPERLDQPDLWDSGKQVSGNSLDIAYAGSPLGSRTRAWWQVECWDEQGGLAQSSSWWEMGLLQVDDWSARWIAVEAEVDRDDQDAGITWTWGDEARHESTRKFRSVLHLDEPADVVIMIGGRDRLDGLWIDGESYPVLRPSPIDFVAQPLTEVRVRLDVGAHLLAAKVSFNPHLAIPQPTGLFCALVRLHFQDGRIERRAAPNDWVTALEADEGWQQSQRNAGNWTPVRVLAEQPTMPWPARPARLVRSEFLVGAGLRSARLYVTALGAYEASLNGVRVGDALLAPEYTDVRARTPYRVFDVTSMLDSGANAIGFLVGDGWFASACAPASRFSFVNAPRRLFAQLELTYHDGRREVIASNETWLQKPSAILTSEIYNGEDYDARLEQSNWDRCGADTTQWQPSRTAPPAPAPLMGDITPPVRVIETLLPRSVVEQSDGTYLFDFGQNFSGVPRLSVKAPAGTKITMRFSELLKDGRIDQTNLRAARAADTYICRGDIGVEVYQPHFTFHGFRYVELSGASGVPRPDIQAHVIHSDLPQIGQLNIQDPVIAGIWRNALWSQRSNFVSIPTDCPQRDERLGWTGDAMVFWDAATLYMDVEAFTRRYLGEVRFGQQEDGAFPLFSPSAWRPPLLIGGTPGWADAGVVLPWVTWQRSGGTSIIEENWDAMTRYLASIQKGNPEMRWVRQRGADFGDWLAVDSKSRGDDTTPKELLATALWAYDCTLMADMADATGRHEQAKFFRSTKEKIAAAFRTAYVTEGGTVGNDSQTSYIFALYFDLLETHQRQPAAQRLAAGIRDRGVVLTTGFLGTPFALHVLADHGYADLAIALLRRTDYPSWGYMLKQGATTMWERWNSDTAGVEMNSFNHYAFGAVSSFLMRRIVGIDSAEPGFRRIRVRPLGVPGLGPVSGSLQSPMGAITVRWNADDDHFSLSLTVPANANAEVHLVGSSPTIAGVAVGESAGIRILHQSPALTVIEVCSGQFEFKTILGLP